MKKEIHPTNYREVAFKDVSTGDCFIYKSTANTNDTIEIEGKTYPLFNIDISSASHPYFTGAKSSAKQKGRVERFNKRFAKTNDK